MPIDVQETGRYEVIAALAMAPDYGDYVALLDNGPTNVDPRKPTTSEIPATGPEVLRNYLPEVLVAVDRPLGWFELTQGRHVITFVCAGKDERSSGYNLGLNAVVLERIPTGSDGTSAPMTPGEDRPAPGGPVLFRGHPLTFYLEKLGKAGPSERADRLRAIGTFGPDAAGAASVLAGALRDDAEEDRAAAAWALSQIGPGAAESVEALATALTDPNARVRGLAAVALRNVGPKAAAAIPALVRALGDPVETVRFPAADAIGAIGPAAGAAVPALVTRLDAPGETRLVLNRLVVALGAIGPQARSALPTLERLIAAHRVEQMAREAVMRIQGIPVPTWW